MPTGFDVVAYGFILFVGGAIGSFLNVCIYRMPREESIVFPASRCPACQTPIKPFDNIPVFGYLMLRGRCRSCQESISVRYPIVEAVTAGVALSSVLWLGLTAEAAALFLFFILLFTASLIDAEHQIIPNHITFPGIAIGFLISLLRTDLTWTDSLLGIVIGGGGLLAIRQLGQLMFKKESMGLGDIKLIAMMGAFIGWQAALASIFLASLLGTIYSIPILIQESRSGQRGEHIIPFGPFLSVGGMIAALLIKMPGFSWFMWSM